MFVGVTPIKVATIWIRGTTKATDARNGVVDNICTERSVREGANR